MLTIRLTSASSSSVVTRVETILARLRFWHLHEVQRRPCGAGADLILIEIATVDLARQHCRPELGLSAWLLTIKDRGEQGHRHDGSDSLVRSIDRSARTIVPPLLNTSVRAEPS
jgi:hypothetical protein